jgi:metal-dependent amidase/aminoacylase/carboxypeptidase family protein
MIRSSDQAYYESMGPRFRAMCEAAAMATDTSVEVAFSGGSATMKDNIVLRDRFLANLTPYGFEDTPIDYERMGSSDMGNVSQVVPTIHPYIATSEYGVPGHSIEFRDAAATPWADEVTLIAATVVAQTAYELYSDPALMAAAWSEFRGG